MNITRGNAGLLLGALALVAVLDGLLLLRQISGPEASAVAARTLGIPA